MSVNDNDPVPPSSAVGGASGSFGIVRNAGETITQGQPLCLKNTSGESQLFLADGNGSAPLPNVIGLAATDAATGGPLRCTRLGFCLAPSGVWDSAPATTSIGAQVYLSNNIGKLTTTAPTNPKLLGVVEFDEFGRLGVDVNAHAGISPT